MIAALERMPSAPNLLRVLTYHRVDDPSSRPDLAPQPLSATPDAFAAQMELLSRRYRVLSLQQVLDHHRCGTRLPSRSVLITFDDAYLDFAKHALPVLQRLELPATMFVPTAYPDDPERCFWWDRLYHGVMQAPAGTMIESSGECLTGDTKQRHQIYRHLSGEVAKLPWDQAEEFLERLFRQLHAPVPHPAVMSWDQLRKIASTTLVTLAPHTRTHPLLNRVHLERAREEVIGSWQDLQQRIGATPRVIAYPGGALSDRVAAMLRAEKFQLAFTTQRGINDLHRADSMRMHRINVGFRCPLSLWRGQLIGAARSAVKAIG